MMSSNLALYATRDMYKKSISNFAVLFAMPVTVLKKSLFNAYTPTHDCKTSASVPATTIQKTHLITGTSAHPAKLP